MRAYKAPIQIKRIRPRHKPPRSSGTGHPPFNQAIQSSIVHHHNHHHHHHCRNRTLIRFDEVYAVHFKTNRRLIREYPHLRNYVADVTQAHGGAVGRT